MGVGGPEPCCRRGKGFDVTLMNLRCVSQREKGSLHHGSSPSVLGLQPHNLVIAGDEVSAVKALSRLSLCSVEEKEVCRDDDDGFKFVTSARLIGPSFLLFWHQCQSVNFFVFFFQKIQATCLPNIYPISRSAESLWCLCLVHLHLQNT